MKIRKMKKGRKIKGGLKQKDPSLTSWQAVYKMIENPASTLKKIAYGSLKGFIFKLDVPPRPENSEFFGLNAAGTDFNVPIYSLIFKFAIVSATEEELPDLVVPGDSKSYGKDTEDLESFKIESQVQQNIYVATATPSGKPICLAVADFSYFDKTASDVLLEKLRLKRGNDAKVNAMLGYLIQNVTPCRKLGMITMELADSNFKELYDFSSNASIFDNLIKYALAQIFILFTKLKVFNYDCHFANVLGKDDGTKTFLIDFGRTLNFTNRNPFPEAGTIIMREYNTITGGNYRNDLIEVVGFSVTDLYFGGRTTEEMVIARMEKIVKFLAYTDYVTNTTYFDMISLGMRPQMIGFLRYLYGESFSDDWIKRPPDWTLTPNAKIKYQSLLPVIRSLTEAPVGAVNRLSRAAVETMMDDKRLFSIQPKVSYDRSDTSGWSKTKPKVLYDSSDDSFENELRGGRKKRSLSSRRTKKRR
jgi:hypothetical protein